MARAPANVVAFPDRANRAWHVIEAELCPMLYQCGASAAQVAHVCATLRPMYVSIADDIHVPLGDDAVARVNEWFLGIVIGLLVQVATREIKLSDAGLA